MKVRLVMSEMDFRKNIAPRIFDFDPSTRVQINEIHKILRNRKHLHRTKPDEQPERQSSLDDFVGCG